MPTPYNQIDNQTNNHTMTTPSPNTSPLINPPSYPPSSSSSQILTVLTTLLSALPHNSLPPLLSPTFPSGGAQTLTLYTTPPSLTTQSISSLMSSLLLILGVKTETFRDIEIKVDKTDQLAMVWARSEISIDGTVVMQGTNALTLHKVEGRWGVSSISDVSGPVGGGE